MKYVQNVVILNSKLHFLLGGVAFLILLSTVCSFFIYHIGLCLDTVLIISL